MKAMKNYINTQCDLDLARTRLDVLLEKKENIQRAYIMAGYKTSLKPNAQSFEAQNMSLYIRELLDKNPATNQSLIQEIVWARKEIRILEQTLDQMKKILYRMNGIARELFVEVACRVRRSGEAISCCCCRTGRPRRSARSPCSSFRRCPAAWCRNPQSFSAD